MAQRKMTVNNFVMQPMTVKPQISIRLNSNTLAALKDEAKSQGRALGNLISHLLDEHVTAKELPDAPR
jgi:hypothetical protein